MEQKNKPSRQEQIEIMTGAKERQDAAVHRWLSDPKFKAALHRREEEPRVKKIAGR